MSPSKIHCAEPFLLRQAKAYSHASCALLYFLKPNERTSAVDPATGLNARAYSVCIAYRTWSEYSAVASCSSTFFQSTSAHWSFGRMSVSLSPINGVIELLAVYPSWVLRFSTLSCELTTQALPPACSAVGLPRMEGVATRAIRDATSCQQTGF